MSDEAGVDPEVFGAEAYLSPGYARADAAQGPR